MRNEVSGEIRELTEQEFFALFDSDTHRFIREAMDRYPDCDAVVCFESLDLGLVARQGPGRQCLVVGPSNTWKLEDLETRHLGDVPSRFKYPVAMWRCLRRDRSEPRQVKL